MPSGKIKIIPEFGGEKKELFLQKNSDSFQPKPGLNFANFASVE